MRVLLVKLSSMGDIIHTLPAIDDAYKAFPEIRFTWLVEAGFQEIAHWHPAVEQVIVTSLRGRDLAKITNSVKELRQNYFDIIIDAQGLLKSAILARLARGKLRVGYDKNSCREGAASMFYSKKIAVSRKLHAIERMRQLFAGAFGYQLPVRTIEYGVNWPQLVNSVVTVPLQSQSDQPYLVFLHGTTWDTKHWPEEYWLSLVDLAAKQGFKVQVTWATAEQKIRAQRFAEYSKAVIMLPHLSINQAVAVLHNARAVVAVDTGFAHLSAALNKPIVAIYGPSDVKKAGTVGTKCINLAANFSCSPCNRRECSYISESAVKPPCLQQITPQLVWDKLMSIKGIL